MRILFILIAPLLLSSCYSGNPDKKYNLKSPCVSADVSGSEQNPCIRRIPSKQNYS